MAGRFTQSERKATVSALLAVLALGACSKPAPEADAPQQAEAPAAAIVVQTATVERATFSTPVIGTGNITPIRMTDIGPSVDGIIEEVMVDVGDVVKKDQPLFRTRDVDIKLQVRELEGQVALARAQHANAQAELKRQQSLQSGGWVSAARMDTTKTNASVASAQLSIWDAKLAQARQMLKDTVVRAPYDGVITRKDIYEGRFMATRMGGMAAPGGSSGVVQIMDIAVVAAIVNVPEVYLPQLALDMPAKVHVDGMARVFDSKVAVLNHRVDTQTRSVELRLAIDNKDLAIKPGLFCRVEVQPAARPVLAVARKAVLGGDGARYAFVAENGRAKKIALSVRDLDAERVEILSNVPAGTKLLTGAELTRLVEGMAVKIEEAPGAAPAAAAPKAASL